MERCEHCGQVIRKRKEKPPKEPKPPRVAKPKAVPKVRQPKGAGMVLQPLARPFTRPLIGALPGETSLDRDKRVLAYIEAHPEQSYDKIAEGLRVPRALVARLGSVVQEKRQPGRKPGAQTFGGPVQRFTPGPPVASTPEERIAAISDEEKARIAAQYGATFKKPKA